MNADQNTDTGTLEKREYRFMEKIMLQHAYIPKLIMDGIGIAIGIYCLWTHHLAIALLALFGASIAGNIIAWKQDLHQLAATPLGKWMLVQARPRNLIIRSIGAIILAVGIWFHEPVTMGLGTAVIILARYSSS